MMFTHIFMSGLEHSGHLTSVLLTARREQEASNKRPEKLPRIMET